MNCPNPKHRKPVVLKTRRTDANGTRVRRVRICPKCRETLVTVEIPTTEYEAEQEAHREEVREGEGEKYKLQRKLNALERFRRALSEFVHGEEKDEDEYDDD